MPQIAMLKRGSPDKIEQLEQLRDNQIRVALAVADIKPSERAQQFVERLAACATMNELEDREGGRIAMLAEMAADAGCQEASYCISGYYTGANPAVLKVVRAVDALPESSAAASSEASE